MHPQLKRPMRQHLLGHPHPLPPPPRQRMHRLHPPPPLPGLHRLHNPPPPAPRTPRRKRPRPRHPPPRRTRCSPWRRCLRNPGPRHHLRDPRQQRVAAKHPRALFARRQPPRCLHFARAGVRGQLAGRITAMPSEGVVGASWATAPCHCRDQRRGPAVVGPAGASAVSAAAAGHHWQGPHRSRRFLRVAGRWPCWRGATHPATGASAMPTRGAAILLLLLLLLLLRVAAAGERQLDAVAGRRTMVQRRRAEYCDPGRHQCANSLHMGESHTPLSWAVA
mmetsp:Transcript_25393/g.63899  ORF Transcript_25393/g.63899 Transcript_25393/m.63899 type:complete len:278 (+) Transcript_25393:3962-4795(+)